MISRHTGEELRVRYRVDGVYVPDALAQIDHFFRDWRSGEIFPIAIATIDILSVLQSRCRSSRPIELLSGYRSSSTNEMLRRRSGAVAKRSLHLRGLAADIRIGGMDVRDVAEIATKCGAGGIGLYPGSRFVHLDCGRRRSWTA